MSTPSELRELDAWIAARLFGDRPDPSKTIPFASEQYCHPHYTTDPAAALAVLEKCAEKSFPTIFKSRATEDWCVDNETEAKTAQFIIATGETLPLAICRFARKIFEK